MKNTLPAVIKAQKLLKQVKIIRSQAKELALDLDESVFSASDLSILKYKWPQAEAMQLLFIFNSMNFCFWAEKDKPKWTKDVAGEMLDGSTALLRFLEQRAWEDRKWLDAEYLSSLSQHKFEALLMGNVQIPQVTERYSLLQISMQKLLADYQGKFVNLYEKSEDDAEKLIALIMEFSSFADTQTYRGIEIDFNKRAQVMAKMVHDISLQDNGSGLKNLNVMTAFADYRVPQILRYLGVLEYRPKLESAVDNIELIERHSEEELEIRIATLYAVELIKKYAEKHLPLITACHVDSYLWIECQHMDKSLMQPYHRTYSTAY